MPILTTRANILKHNQRLFEWINFSALQADFKNSLEQLPYTLLILLENLARHSQSSHVQFNDILAFDNWLTKRTSDHEIAFHPARVLMQDFTGVPAVVDLAAMRHAMEANGYDPKHINPQIPVDLIIDHSVQVDQFGHKGALSYNTQLEMARNHERYQLLKWGQQAFKNFRVVPPGTGICHQVNLEYLATVVQQKHQEGITYLYPDTVVGTDSHTTMINGLGVLGWGVGGIEAEAAMLGQPISMTIPDVVGLELTGALAKGVTATDLVLTITELLRLEGVVGKLVEFYGQGLSTLTLPDRATIANMAPEYGATCGFFPIDSATLDYLALTGRALEQIAIIEYYAKQQGLWHTPHKARTYSQTLQLNLAKVQPSMAGPKRPQDRVDLSQLSERFTESFATAPINTMDTHPLSHGDIVIAAITSCTNTSNPSILLTAGLLAKNAATKGLTTKPWVKASLAPGSKVVTSYLAQTGLLSYLEQLGFYTVGYGCTTCIGNSGPLSAEIHEQIRHQQLIVCSVLSGNRNFEGRIHADVKANWLASPPLVVAFAIAGTLIDLETQPLGFDQHQQPVYLQDIWPSQEEIDALLKTIDAPMFKKNYQDLFTGDQHWQQLTIHEHDSYQWDPHSSYIRHPEFFSLPNESKHNIHRAHILALLGHSITTDHISPAGAIPVHTPAGAYLLAQGVKVTDFNSYGARRGNHEVMVRGTFANIRLRNKMLQEEGGFTLYIPDGTKMTIYEAAMRYRAHHRPTVIIAGMDYGTGSSRDWAAKGTRLLGISAIIAESFERIHRSNLIGMGVLPIEFPKEVNQKTLKLTGHERLSITGIDTMTKPRAWLTLTIDYPDKSSQSVQVLARLDTEQELDYFHQGGILNYVLNQLMAK